MQKSPDFVGQQNRPILLTILLADFLYIRQQILFVAMVIVYNGR